MFSIQFMICFSSILYNCLCSNTIIDTNTVDSQNPESNIVKVTENSKIIEHTSHNIIAEKIIPKHPSNKELFEIKADNNYEGYEKPSQSDINFIPKNNTERQNHDIDNHILENNDMPGQYLESSEINMVPITSNKPNNVKPKMSTKKVLIIKYKKDLDQNTTRQETDLENNKEIIDSFEDRNAIHTENDDENNVDSHPIVTNSNKEMTHDYYTDYLNQNVIPRIQMRMDKDMVKKSLDEFTMVRKKTHFTTPDPIFVEEPDISKYNSFNDISTFNEDDNEKLETDNINIKKPITNGGRTDTEYFSYYNESPEKYQLYPNYVENSKIFNLLRKQTVIIEKLAQTLARQKNTVKDNKANNKGKDNKATTNNNKANNNKANNNNANNNKANNNKANNNKANNNNANNNKANNNKTTKKAEAKKDNKAKDKKADEKKAKDQKAKDKKTKATTKPTTKTTTAKTTTGNEFDELMAEMKIKQEIYKKSPNYTSFTFETTTTTTTTVSTTTARPTTVLTLFDETEVRNALRNDPHVRRILKMASRQREKYLKNARKYYDNQYNYNRYSYY